MSTTTGTLPGIRIIDMPDLGTVTDGSSLVGELAGSGRFTAPALRTYIGTTINNLTAAGTVTAAVVETPVAQVSSWLVIGDYPPLSLPDNMGGDQAVIPFVAADALGINCYTHPGGATYATIQSGICSGLITSNVTGIRIGMSAPQGAGIDISSFPTYFDLGMDGSLTLLGSLRVHPSDTSICVNTAGTHVGICGGTALLDASTAAIILNGGDRGVYALELYANGARVAWFGGDGQININAAAYKPGGGPWTDSSDARIKTVTGDYTHGLAEILQLNPKTFTFLGNETGPGLPPIGDDGPAVRGRRLRTASPHFQVAADNTEFVGLVAQEVEPVLPEMVTDVPGTIDGAPVTDLKVLDTTALIYSLVNAIKTLEARLAALEAAP